MVTALAARSHRGITVYPCSSRSAARGVSLSGWIRASLWTRRSLTTHGTPRREHLKGDTALSGSNPPDPWAAPGGSAGPALLGPPHVAEGGVRGPQDGGRGGVRGGSQNGDCPKWRR